MEDYQAGRKRKHPDEEMKEDTTFSSEVHFWDELRIVSGDLSLQI